MGTVKYMGPVASFHCPTNAEIRSLKVHFSPKQEGTGDPSPENVREIVGWDGMEVSQHGRNLYSKDNVIPHTVDDEWNCIMAGVKQKIAVSSWPRWTFIAPAIPNATYYWTASCYDVGFLDKDKNVLTYKSGWNNTNVKAPVNAAYVYHTWIKNESLSQEQLDTAFKSYDLYCDMPPTIFEEQNSKKTDYEFGVLGKNKFNWNVPASESSPVGSDPSTAREFTLDTYVIGMAVNNYYRQNYTNWVLNPSVENGVISFSSGGASAYGIAFPLKLAAGQIYFLSGTGNGSAGATYYNENGEFISYQSDRLNKTITVPENAATTLIGFYASSTNTDFTFSDIQLELGSTATEYEPYDPKHTVYGGWVDLISGEVCEEKRVIEFNGSESKWYYYKQNTYDRAIFTYGDTLGILSDNYFLSNFFGTQISGIQLWHGFTSVANKWFQLNVDADEFANVNEWKTYLSEHPLKICYSLPEPVIYHLAPIQLQTFLGQNNVWSNADYVEVEYDLYETQTILARKQFIVANQPHIISPAAAPLQNFVTDMVAPLKECRVYFEPVQEGEGDPSPDNVRPITGWTGCEVYRTGKNLFDATDFCAKISTYFSVNQDNGVHVIRPYSSGWIGQPITGYIPKGTYTLSVEGTQTDNDVDVRPETGAWYGWTASNGRQTKTLADGMNYLLRPTNVTAGDDLKIQIEADSTVTSFSPYFGITLPIDWSNSAGTIYGGYVDLVRGEMAQEWDIVELNNPSQFNKWNRDYNELTYLDFYIYLPNVTECVSNITKACSTRSIALSSGVPSHWVQTGSNSYVGFMFPASFFSTHPTMENRNDLIQEILNHSSIKLAYKTNQTTYSIDPITLKTLRGTNNIWSNAGDITLSYWKH